MVKETCDGREQESYGKFQINTFVKGLAERIFHVHLHDVRTKDLTDHIACGEGMVDILRLIPDLRTVSYQGLMTFEVIEGDRTEAIIRSKRHLERILISQSRR